MSHVPVHHGLDMLSCPIANCSDVLLDSKNLVHHLRTVHADRESIYDFSSISAPTLCRETSMGDTMNSKGASSQRESNSYMVAALAYHDQVYSRHFTLVFCTDSFSTLGFS